MYEVTVSNKVTQQGKTDQLAPLYKLRQKCILQPPLQIASEVTKIGKISVVMHVSD